MIEVKVKQIGEYTYHVQQFGAREGSKWLVVLARIVAKPLAMAFEKAGDATAAVVSALTDALMPDEFERIRDAFVARTEISGGPFGERHLPLSECFDMVFAGHYADMLVWLSFCLEINYTDFFGGLPGLTRAPKTPPVSAETQAKG